MGRSLLESLLVVSAGLLLAFAGNALRSQGLSPGRDYFPQDSAGTGPPPPTGARARMARPDAQDESAAAASSVGSEDASAQRDSSDAGGPDALDREVAARLASKGLHAIGHAEFVELMQSPLAKAGAYLIVDARRAEEYAEGHIAGAVHLDPFFPDAGLAAVLPQLPVAQRVIVYCHGGECDDSESAALLLLQFGADAASMAIYTGGISAWSAAGLPLVTSDHERL